LFNVMAIPINIAVSEYKFASLEEQVHNNASPGKFAHFSEHLPFQKYNSSLKRLCLPPTPTKGTAPELDGYPIPRLPCANVAYPINDDFRRPTLPYARAALSLNRLLKA